MLFCGSVGGSGLNQVTSTFWDGTKSFLGGEPATIPHFKDDIQGFHMHPKPAIVNSDFLEFKDESHLCHFPPRTNTLADLCRFQSYFMSFIVKR